jgi:hypothetical protein
MRSPALLAWLSMTLIALAMLRPAEADENPLRKAGVEPAGFVLPLEHDQHVPAPGSIFVYATPKASESLELVNPIGGEEADMGPYDPSLRPVPMPIGSGVYGGPPMHAVPEQLPPTPTELLWFHYITRAWSPHHDPNDPHRHFGVGDPLIGTSWRNRPVYVSVFAGGLLGDELQAGVVEQGGGMIFGGRFGGDFDHYWGAEVRLAFSDLHVNYPGDVSSGKSSNSYFDASLLYYPLGDTRWRPYFTVGFGIAGYHYTDAEDRIIRTSAIAVPWGGGVKYLLTRHMALRFDVIDNFTFAARKADSMHNLMFTGGVEFRFGGRSVDYGGW